MLLIRKVADATTAANRSAIEAAQTIMREQFPAMPAYDIDKLPEQLANPLKHRFVSRLFVAENARDQTLGVALLLHAPDIGFSYLELISTAPTVVYEVETLDGDQGGECQPAQILRALRGKADRQYRLRNAGEAYVHRSAVSPARSARFERPAQP